MKERLAVAKMLVERAGAAILAHAGAGSARKQDGFPVTEADLAANKLIVTGLKERFPDDGLLSEETEDDGARLERRGVWIIDPLDGTKEFLKGNGEFTVNVAYVIDGRPVLGAIGLPAKRERYYASPDGAFWEHDGRVERISVSARDRFAEMVLVVSRSHLTPDDERLNAQCGFARMERAGSSLKGCLVARGAADVYARAGQTNEWDICAMDCILAAAGGRLTDRTGKPFKYNRRDPRIKGFLASNGQCHEELLRVMDGQA